MHKKTHLHKNSAPCTKSQTGFHKEVPCKVKAYIDEDIKPLVEILNTIDNIATIQSCQGGNGRLAEVDLDYGNGSKPYDNGKWFHDMTCFTNKLVSLFAKYTGESIIGGYHSNISIEWWGDKRYPHIHIVMPHNSIDAVTKIFSHVRRELNHDKFCKRP